MWVALLLIISPIRALVETNALALGEEVALVVKVLMALIPLEEASAVSLERAALALRTTSRVCLPYTRLEEEEEE